MIANRRPLQMVFTLLMVLSISQRGLYAKNSSTAKKAKQLFHFGLGPVWFHNFGVESSGYGLQGGRDFEVEFGNAFIDLNLALHEQGVGSLGSHIGLNYYKNITSTINFLGGGKGGISYVNSKIHENNFSFSMGLQTGFRFFPKSDIHIDITLHYLAYVSTTGSSTPSQFLLSLTLSSPWIV